MKNRIVYLSFKRNDGTKTHERGEKYITDKGSLVSYSLGGKYLCVTTTINCLIHNNWLADLDYEVKERTYHQEAMSLMKALVVENKRNFYNF